MKIRVTSQYLVMTPDDLASHVGSLMRELVGVESERHWLAESDVSAVLAHGVVELSTVVDAESWEEASSRAEDAFEEAITRVGGRVGSQPNSVSDLTARIRGTEMVPA